MAAHGPVRPGQAELNGANCLPIGRLGEGVGPCKSWFSKILTSLVHLRTFSARVSKGHCSRGLIGRWVWPCWSGGSPVQALHYSEGSYICARERQARSVERLFLNMQFGSVGDFADAHSEDTNITSRLPWHFLWSTSRAKLLLSSGTLTSPLCNAYDIAITLSPLLQP